jgi:putative acetyltransferase
MGGETLILIELRGQNAQLISMQPHAIAEIFAAFPEHIPLVQSLWREYWESMGLPLDFQAFEEEVLTLPGRYAPPGGRLLLATAQGKPAGTVALRLIAGAACEAKRLYVRPEFRGQGVGDALVRRIIEEARAAGYREMFADSLPSMTAAMRMYQRFGFSETTPYSLNPTPGAVFLRLDL